MKNKIIVPSRTAILQAILKGRDEPLHAIFMENGKYRIVSNKTLNMTATRYETLEAAYIDAVKKKFINSMYKLCMQDPERKTLSTNIK